MNTGFYSSNYSCQPIKLFKQQFIGKLPAFIEFS